MASEVHLIIDSGPAKGREITVPPEGIRIGRSSRNDLCIDDPALSRFHCRLFFKGDGALWVSDLGSANGTLVNSKEIQEQPLAVGDVCSLGETNIRVVNMPATGALDAGTATPGRHDAGINLGLGGGGDTVPTSPRRRWLYLALVVMALAALLATLPIKPWINAMVTAVPATPAAVTAPLPPLDIVFERVEAGPSNIFRFAMAITGGRLTVHVDDLATGRHVRREKPVVPELLEDLARICERSGFLELQPKYEGVAPGIYELTDIVVTLGARTHRVQVVNHLDPEPLATLRAQLEEFSRNELGLAALAIEPAELVNRAREAHGLGQKLFAEREVDPGNLAKAIRAFTEAEWYLETIEPKPAFHADAVARRSECERELQGRYENVWFLAERSIKLREWKEAAIQLRLVCDMIPDRSDDRHQNAYRKLVDVERHIAKDK